ncbi:hypothetical protein [Bibersteinia trehalosi]|uniref:hypothetical protein n=1 Tax=Bibersteinia trehalosi TaxID=47735 RepID=UPI00404539CF
MEKLLKKTINKSIALNRFDFSGFSSSNLWVGYFESKNVHNLNLIKEALNLVYDFFKEDLNGFVAVSALKYSKDYDFKNEEIYYFKLLKRAKRYNLIQESTEMFENYLYGDIPLPADCLTISFDKRFFPCLAELVMGCNAVLGKVCFFISPKLNIAIYPHEDLGFGIVSLSEDNSLCIEFLKFCSKNKNFIVYIEN